MSAFFDYLKTMGGLHDATVEEIRLDLAGGNIELRFEDLYSNFEGLPEYPGAENGAIILGGVSELEMNVDSKEPLKVYEFLQHEDHADEVLITFSPSGRLRIRFESVSYPPCRLRP